jgi:predicted permease
MLGLQRWWHISRMRTRSVLRRTAAERDLEKELRFHLTMDMEEARSHGALSDQAQSFALKKLGGITQIQEECRDMRRMNFLESLKQDLRFALRTLFRNPGFAFVMLATLSLSIGATTAIVSVVNGVLLRPLPFREPDRLVRVFTSAKAWPKFPVNPNDFHDWRERLHSFESMAAYTHSDLQWANGSAEPVKLAGFSISAGFFRVLGFHPELGREFDSSDELPGKQHSVIISDRVWRTRLGGRRDALGKTIMLESVPYALVGVMPAGVEHPGNMYHAVLYGQSIDAWTPFTFEHPEQRGSHFMDVVARLRPGVSAGAAQGELNAVMAQLAHEHPGGDSGWNVMAIPIAQEVVGHSRRILFVLLVAVALLMALACVNAANLLLANASSRQREIALRTAVGAARARVVRQLLTESLLLAGAGAALGALFAVLGVRALRSVLPPDFPRANDIRVDGLMLLFTLVLAIAVGVFFGTIPALQGSRVDLRESLHESGRSATNSRSTVRLRSALVICEVTMACVLLIGASLMLRSFVNLLKNDPGFDAEHVLTATISLPEARYKDVDVPGFYRHLLAELQNTSGVLAAGAGSDLPWTGWDDNAGGFQIQGETPPPKQSFHARYHAATPGFFRALGIPVLRGRAFEDRDTNTSGKTLIINEAMSRLWQHGSALGGKVTFSDAPKEKDWMTVVGIVKDVKDTPKDSGAQAGFWWPVSQEPFPVVGNGSLAIRSNLDTNTMAARLRSVVSQLDQTLAVSDVRTMDVVADGSYSTSRFAFVLVAAFAGLAVVLAAIGTYGVIAYSVSHRIHEFGIRMALGASRWQILSSVLAKGMILALAGTALGVLLGVAFSRLLGDLLFGVRASDPVAIAATASVALIVAVVACYLPARRATHADPMTALRAD